MKKKRTNPPGAPRSRYYARYLAHYTKKNYAVLLLGGLFVAGVLFGTLLVRSASETTTELLLRIVGDYVDRRREQVFLQNITSGLSGSLATLGALFVCGFCAIGHPVELALPLVRGLGFGFSAASLYLHYGTQAIGFVGVFMLPGMIITTIAVLLCCHESLKLSSGLLSLLQRKEAPQNLSVRVYCARFIAGGILCALCAVLEATLFALFRNAFLLG